MKEPTAKIFISPYSNNKLEIVNGFARERHNGKSYLFDDLHGSLSPFKKENDEIIYVIKNEIFGKKNSDCWMIKKGEIISYQKKLPKGAFVRKNLTDAEKIHNNQN